MHVMMFNARFLKIVDCRGKNDDDEILDFARSPKFDTLGAPVRKLQALPENFLGCKVKAFYDS